LTAKDVNGREIDPDLKMHWGFAEHIIKTINRHRKCLITALRRQAATHKKILITGHSLGAGQARTFA
jgi:hypothetical protein